MSPPLAFKSPEKSAHSSPVNTGLQADLSEDCKFLNAPKHREGDRAVGSVLTANFS